MIKVIRSLIARIISFRKFSVHRTINLDQIISEDEIYDELNDT